MAEDVFKPMIFFYVEYNEEIIECFDSIEATLDYIKTHVNLLQDHDNLQIYDNWGYTYNPITGMRSNVKDLLSIIPL